MTRQNVDSYIPLFGRDFLTATMGWTAEERGHYVVLLITQWEQGHIPSEIERLELVSQGCSGSWVRLEAKFPIWEDGLRRNRRLEEHRRKASDLKQARADKAQKAAQARWGKDAPSNAPSNARASHEAMREHGEASQAGSGRTKAPKGNVEKTASRDAPSMRQAMLEQCPPSPSPSPSNKKEEVLPSSSLEKVPLPSFPCDKGNWIPTREMVAEWKATYPDLDVHAQLRRARQWLVDNPSRRKTPKGMRRFVGSWLANAMTEPKPVTPSKKVLATL